MIVISNSSAIILLEKISKLDILRKLYGKLIIPEAVCQGIFRSRTKSKYHWIEVVPLKQPIPPLILRRNLGPGESQAIALYLELTGDLLILDDLAARKTAESLDLKITGVVGVLLVAKDQTLISSVKDLLDELIKNDFRISDEFYKSALKISREQDQ